MVAGNYMGELFLVYWVFENVNGSVLKARRPYIGEITAHVLAGTIHPATFIIKKIYWGHCLAHGGWVRTIMKNHQILDLTTVSGSNVGLINLATRMFKINVTRRYGLALKQFQILFYQPGVLFRDGGR